MRNPAVMITFCLLINALLLVSNVSATDLLEIVCDKHRASGDSELIDVYMAANKAGIMTGKLTTPLGAYDFVADGDVFAPELDFFVDHMGWSFVQLVAAIEGGWILTWDEGLGTQTVANIGFGAIPEDDFLPVPTLTSPPDGSVIFLPNPPTIAWNYGAMDPCAAQPDIAEVRLVGFFDEIGSDALPCTATSWTPPFPLQLRPWSITPLNAISIRAVADGIGRSIEGDPWILENLDRLDLQSSDRSSFSMVEVSTHASGLGESKA